MSDLEKLSPSEMLFYETADGKLRVEIMYGEETFWLSQKRMAELFGVDVRTVSEHLKNIFASQELAEDSVIRKFRTAAADGKAYLTNFYSLDAIIAVGYRVNSYQATQFRIWATRTLKEYLIKGFVLDDQRLKHGSRFGKDYFEELLERIREIRASERRFYQKVTDLFEQCSIDYDSNAPATRQFFATIQYKLEYAVTGQTAPEIIANRAKADEPNMGLTTWKNAPKGKILKSDATVGKNYLNQDELTKLNRLVNRFLDDAERQVEQHRALTMDDWARRLDAFLEFNGYNILTSAGSVSRDQADRIATEAYAQFRITQDRNYESDFDRQIKRLKGDNNQEL